MDLGNVGICGVALFLIGTVLGLLLNLVSGDLEDWYLRNRNPVLIVTAVLIIGGVILTFLSVRLSRQDEDGSQERETGG